MPLHPVTLGLKFAVRISTLTPADVVEVVCGQCGHRHMVAPYQLILRFPLHTRLIDLPARFRCRSCRAEGGGRIAVYRAEPPLRSVE